MVPPERRHRALEAVGFVDRSLTNRNPGTGRLRAGTWHVLKARAGDAFLTVLDEAALDEQVGIRPACDPTPAANSSSRSAIYPSA